MNTIKICDAPMGTGKTTAAINYINAHKEKNFLFITPYLNEVDRVINSCMEREFVAPKNNGSGKLQNIEEHLQNERCIASTHTLFSGFTSKTSAIVEKSHYTLILDETFDVIELVNNITPKDIQVVFDSLATYDPETLFVKWQDDEYNGKFNEIKKMAQSNRLIYFNDKFLLWLFPPDIFRAFDEVIVMTYLFDSQIQAYYHTMQGFKTERIYIEKTADGDSRFTTQPTKYPDLARDLDKIHIFDSFSESIPEYQAGGLSKSWFLNNSSRSGSSKKLKNGVYNFFKYKCKVTSQDVIWTTFKDYSRKVAPSGYAKSFVPCNSRATNEFKDRHYLAYCANIFVNPIIVNYFRANGIEMDQNGYALTMLLQWIWRSAIRDGEDVYVYIPSVRMRELFEDWMSRVKKEAC